jgi:putative ABC transport system substrate-binding protein
MEKADNTRREAIALLCLGGLAPGFTLAQPAHMPRIGVLGYTSAERYAPQVNAFKDSLRDHGYVEGRTCIVEARWSNDDGDKLVAYAQELVRLKCDVVVTSGSGTRAMFNATRTIPVVFAASGDPVADGYVATLARPGGNFTGGTFFGVEIVTKRLELLRQVAHRISRVAVLANPLQASNLRILELAQDRIKGLKMELVNAPAKTPAELEGAFQALVQGRAEGVVVLDESMLVANLGRIAQLSRARKLPCVGPPAFADEGGLLGYGVDFPDMWRNAASFVARILKGASPATMPVEAATRFNLVANRGAATALGISLPQELLLRADRVV